MIEQMPFMDKLPGFQRVCINELISIEFVESNVDRRFQTEHTVQLVIIYIDFSISGHNVWWFSRQNTKCGERMKY